jgi:predicted XRE-type DNA-binding protein
MDKEILKPSEELESNTFAPSGTSTEETPIEVPIQKETPAPTGNETPGTGETFEQSTITRLDEDTPHPSVSPEEEARPSLVTEEITIEALETTSATEKIIAETVTTETPVIEEVITKEFSMTKDMGSEEIAETNDPEREEVTKQEEKTPAELVENKIENKVEQHVEQDRNTGEKTAPSTVEIVPSKTPPTWDFTSLNTEEIISHMKMLIENYPVNQLKVLDSLPALFEAQYQKEYAQARESQAGSSDFPNDTKERFNSIYRLYREKRASYYKRSEEEKEENLKTKLQIIEELKELIQKEESLHKTFQEFRNLQERWRNTGIVPQVNLNDLLETYHLHVENFYNYIKINKELRDLDLKKNLDKKIKLCEQAEHLIEENNFGHAVKQLQQLHGQWREIGPVPNDQKEWIWERFKGASNKINEAYRRFIETLKEEYENNLKIKEDICTQIEKFAALTPKNLSEWREFTRQVLKLQEEWEHVGTIPQKERGKLYKRFRDTCDTFFNKKRVFFQKQQEEEAKNLELKIALCEKVEAVQHSTEWKNTMDKIIALQREWKKIGPVSRKHSNKIWMRFRTACDIFFENKAAQTKSSGTNQHHNLELKRALVEEVRTYVLSGNNEEDINALRNFQVRWTEIGFVPIKEKDAIQSEFRNLINTLFDQLGISEFDRDIERFKFKVNTFDSSSETKDFKIIQERERLTSKIKQLEADLHVWENNIGFFSKSTNSEGYIKEFSAKIEDARHKLTLMHEKLKVIDDMI